MIELTECCNAKIDWEIWACDKNPKGIIPEPKNHGNEIDGMITCSDEYCSPRDISVEDPTDEFIRTHEVHSRCSKCAGLTGD